jgi:predicted nucleic acid-binding protein
LTKTSRLIKKFDDQALTLADAHGLVMINEHRISTCWSTDRHLGLTGAKLVVSSASL